MPITTLLFAISMLIGMGGGANISLSMGRGEKEKAQRFIGNGFLFCMAATFIVTVILYAFLEPILIFFGASINVLPYAKTYLRIILFGSTINSVSFCLNRYILSQGFVSISMITMLLNVILNTIFTPLFIFGFGWGIAGAAWGTVIGQIASAGWVFYYLTMGKTPLKLNIKNIKLDFDIIKNIITLGTAPALLQLAISFVQTITNNSLKTYGGDVSMAVMGIVSAISMMVLMPIFGINQGVQPIIGFNYGAKYYDRVKRLLIQTIVTATVVVTSLWLLLMLFTQNVVTLFVQSNDLLMEEGVFAIRTYLLALPVVGFQVIGGSYFQSIGKPVKSLILTLSRQLFFLVPAMLILPLFFGIKGVYYAGPVSDSISTILTAILLAIEIKI
jgi:putative MATE family efflux protein